MKTIDSTLIAVLTMFSPCFLRAAAHQYHAPLAFSLRRNVDSKRQVQPEKPLLDDLAVQQSTEQSTGKTSLEFQAAANYATDPLLVSTDSPSTLQNKLSTFLFEDSHRDMILAGADSQNEVQLQQYADIELYRLWQVETSRIPNLASPSVGDAILRVTTTGIHFPGLALKTVATVGCKKVLDDSTNTASLQITLINDELQAEGPAPLLWVFQQLTGTGKQNKSGEFPPSPFSLLRGNNNQDADQQRRTHSTNVITAECTATDKDAVSIVFCSAAQLSISVSFPSILLKILPVSKEMAESQGSEAINRVVTRDIGPSLEALKKKFEVECIPFEEEE
jgi:hypothetical protein